jgi:mannose-6-phosphate isomerase
VFLGIPAEPYFRGVSSTHFGVLGSAKWSMKSWRAAGENRKVFEREQGVTSMLQSARDRDNAAIPALELLPCQAEIRPWGAFWVLDEGPMYKIKRIEVKPGHRLSLQMHYHRSEHWIVVRGTARVTRGEEVMLLNSNESTYIPPCTKHRLENPGTTPLVVIEVQNGEYLGEDDIVRFEDDYARS